MKEYSELRRLAEAATKCYGAMRVEKDYNGVYQVVGAGSWNILSAWHTPDGKSKDNAEFHAAARPDAVLELIAEVESLKKDAARYRWLRDNDFDIGSFHPAHEHNHQSWFEYFDDESIDYNLSMQSK